jgi:trans-2,3-dihydro-3-hydroxyanthranilate isomerase
MIASEQRVIIEQGLEIGRPSQLYVRAKKANGRITDVHVGGYAVEIARGEYLLP